MLLMKLPLQLDLISVAMSEKICSLSNHSTNKSGQFEVPQWARGAIFKIEGLELSQVSIMVICKALVFSVFKLQLDEVVRFLKKCQGLHSRNVVVLLNQLICYVSELVL